MKKRQKTNRRALTGGIRVEGSAVGSALITGNGNVVTIVYASDVLRSRQLVGANPYRGLDSFDEASSQLYFGRERLVATLLDRLEHLTSPNGGAVRLLAIMGPSGCGKSSVARAGLIPSLASAKAPWLRMPQVAILRPGYSPIEALADALARLVTGNSNPVEKRRSFGSLLREAAQSSLNNGLSRIARENLAEGNPLIVVVDQFEETYNLCRPLDENNTAQVKATKKERDAFVATLLQAAAEPGGSVSIVITLRSDFYGALVEHPELSATVASDHEIVSAMTRDDLQRAIAEPARVEHHPLDPAAVARILDETVGENSALPLMQFALERIWERMRDGITPDETLTALGGVGGALANRAGEILVKLPGDSRKLAERAFLACVQLGDSAPRDTRHRAWMDEVTPAGIEMEECKRAMEPFIKARLLATGADENGRIWLELPHEALIRSWHTLRNWIEVQRDDLRFKGRLQAASEAWEHAKRPRGSLWRTPDLELLRRYAARDHHNLTKQQRDFLVASERENNREWWIVQSGMAVVILLAMAAGYFAYDSGQQARVANAEALAAQQQERNAIAGRLASQSRLGDSTQEKLLLAVEATTVSLNAGEPPLPIAESALAQALEVVGGRGLNAHLDQVFGLAFTAAGRHLLTASFDKTARLWDLSAANPGATSTLVYSDKEQLSSAMVSKHGRWALVFGSIGGNAVLWRTETAIERWKKYDIGSDVSAAYITPDEKWAATGYPDGSLKLWDLSSTDDPTTSPVSISGHQKSIVAIAAPSDGRFFVSGDEGGTIVLHDLRDDIHATQKFTLEGGSLQSLDLSPSGRLLVAASTSYTDEKGAVRAWDLKTNETSVLWSHDLIPTVHVSSDDRWVLVSGWNGSSGSARISAMPSVGLQASFYILRSAGQRIFYSTLSPDSRYLALGNEGPTVDVCMLIGTVQPACASVAGEQGPTKGLSFSPDGNLLAAGTGEGDVRVWNLAKQNASALPDVFRPMETTSVLLARLSPHGFLLGTDKFVRTLNVRDGQIVEALRATSDKASILKMAATADGETLAVSYSNGDVELWRIDENRKGHLVASIQEPSRKISAMALAIDGNKLFVGYSDGSIDQFSVRDNTLLQKESNLRPEIKGDEFGDREKWPIDVSADGMWLVPGGAGKALYVWKLLPNNFVGFKTVIALDFYPNLVSFSPNGRWLSAAGRTSGTMNPGSGRVWDLRSLPENTNASEFVQHDQQIVLAAFRPDSTMLLTGGDDGVAKVWSAPYTSGAASMVFRGHDWPVKAVAFGEGAIFTGGDDGMIFRWNINVENPAAIPIPMA
jgi:WD40 repeat protein